MYFEVDCSCWFEEFEWGDFSVRCEFSDVEDVFEHFFVGL